MVPLTINDAIDGPCAAVADFIFRSVSVRGRLEYLLRHRLLAIMDVPFSAR